MTVFRMTWRIAVALLIGCVVTLWYIQRDPRFHEHVAQLVRGHFSSTFNCAADGKVISINIFNPTIIARDINVQAGDGSWSWHADELRYQFSWFDSLRAGIIVSRVTLDGYKVSSIVNDQKIAFADHIHKLMSSMEGLPIMVKRVVMNKGFCTLTHASSGTDIYFSFKSEISAFFDRFKTSIYINDGAINVRDDTVCSHIHVQAHGEVGKNAQVTSWGALTGSVNLEHLKPAETTCFFRGQWNDDGGTVYVHNKDLTFVCEELKFEKFKDVNDLLFFIKARAPLAYFAHAVHAVDPDIEVQGTCQFEASGSLFDLDGTVTANVDISDIGYQNYNLGTVHLTCVKQHGAWRGDCNIDHNNSSVARGSWVVYGIDGSGSIELESMVSIPAWPTRYWNIEPHNFRIKGMWNADGSAYGTFNCKALHSKLEIESVISGACAYNNRQFTIQGVHDQTSYMAQGTLLPLVRLHHFRYRDSQGRQVITCKADDDSNTLNASIEYPFFKTILDDYVGYRIPGKGTLKAQTTIEPWGMSAAVWLENAQIRLHDTYNFIRDGKLNAEFNWAEKRFLIKDCHLDLQQGSLHCSRATCFWDSSGITFIHAPLLMDKVFLNIEKDLFAELSGSSLVCKDEHSNVVHAHIILDRGQLKKNIFSSIVQENMTRYLLPNHDAESQATTYDATITTKQPLHVKTPFLQTDAHINIAVKGTIDKPDISGSIKLINGSLRFPYKPLFINHGVIYFTPDHAHDPMIELHARGRVKRYSIAMHVSGSLQQPFISFESTPSLSEEQIITLLLAGSEEGSLRVVMPSLIMKNVQGLLFSSEHTPSKMETYLNNILVPLRHVRLVPSFSDQTARGGFRWALEVDVSDKFHGVIQKNFSLSEDTRIEVEYFFSDDMGVRALKDERGDIAGELEMRWKF